MGLNFPEKPHSPKPKPSFAWHSLLSQGVVWLLSFLCLAYVFKQVKPEELWNAIEHFNWPYLFVGVFSLSLGYAMRIQRWAILLRAGGGNVSTHACTVPFLGSIALNNVLPLRAGDIVRALIFPASLGVTRTTATASLVLERLIDLLTLLICLAAGVALSPMVHLPSWVKESIVTLSSISCGLMICILFFTSPVSRFLKKITEWATESNHPRISQISDTLHALLENMKNMARWRILLVLLGISLLVWAGETGLYWAFMAGSGLSATPEMALMVMALATLSTLAPSSPGYVGTFHLATYSAVMLLGGTAAEATGFAFLTHFCLWSSTTLAGAIAILSTPRLFQKKQR